MRCEERIICKSQGNLPHIRSFLFMYFIITHVLDGVLNLKIGMPRSTQVDGQPTGLLPLFVIKWI